MRGEEDFDCASRVAEKAHATFGLALRLLGIGSE